MQGVITLRVTLKGAPGPPPEGSPYESQTAMPVDTHQHFWNLEREAQSWLTDEHAVIRRTFRPEDLEPLLERAGVERTVLVQAACSDLDTDTMFEHASLYPWIGAVVAWVDLRSPERARERLDDLRSEPKLRGVRHLIHNEPDPHWILQAAVLTSLAALQERGMILELPCVFPRHLGDVPELAANFPRLTIVIDHLAKPPLGSDAMGAWATELHAAASTPNVFAKISGLNTMLPSRRLGCGRPARRRRGCGRRVRSGAARLRQRLARRSAER